MQITPNQEYISKVEEIIESTLSKHKIVREVLALGNLSGFFNCGYSIEYAPYTKTIIYKLDNGERYYIGDKSKLMIRSVTIKHIDTLV